MNKLRTDLQSPTDPGVGLRSLVPFLGWTVTGDLSSKVAVLLTMLVAARALTPLEFAEYVGLWAVAAVVVSCWDVGLSQLLTNEFATDRMSARAALKRVLVLRARTFVLWVVTFAIGVVIVNRKHDLSLITIVAFAGASLCIASSAIALAMLRARLRFRIAWVSITSGRWLTALLSLSALPAIGLAHGLDLFAAACLAGEVLVLGLATAAVVIANLEPAPLAFTECDAGQILTLRKSLPFAANNFLSIMYNRADILIVASFASIEQLALYAPASRIQDALYLVPGAIESVAFPVISRLWVAPEGSDQVRRLVNRLVVLGLALSVPIACVAFIFTPEILRYVLGPEYVGAATPTRILIWFLPMAAIGAPVLAALAGTGRAVDTTKAFAVTAFVAIMMHLALDWRFGAVGGAVASLSRDPAGVSVAVVLAWRAGLFGPSRVRPLKPELLEAGVFK